RPEVKDPGPPRDGLADRGRILQVAPHDLQRVLNLRRQVAEMSPVVAAIVAHQHPDAMPLTHQALGEMAADEPPCPGDQHRLVHRYPPVAQPWARSLQPPSGRRFLSTRARLSITAPGGRVAGRLCRPGSAGKPAIAPCGHETPRVRPAGPALPARK